MTWRDLAAIYPEFVQFVVARFGPLPEGLIEQDDFVRYWAAFEASNEDDPA